MKDLCALIMAAGKGTRMVSNRAKVLHTVCGVTMLQMIYRAAAGVVPEEIFVIVGQDAERVRTSLEGQAVSFILQAEQLGTGHAVISARDHLKSRPGDVLILFGDTPCVKTETLAKLVDHHRQTGAATTLLTTVAPDPYGYGRILRHPDGRVYAIVEEKDATPEQQRINEINPGFYCFRIEPLLQALEKLSNDNAQHEYYITDLIGIQVQEGLCLNAVIHAEFEELRGINTRRDLAELSAALRRHKNLELMLTGVTLIDPDRAYIDLDVTIEKDAIIYPMAALEGRTRIGEGVIVHSGSRIANSTIGANVEILESCLITDSEIKAGTSVGPCAHIKKQSVIGENCRIGNFVEIKRSTLGNGTKAAHLAYLGDAVIGERVNIGAGVITCNYDGIRKSATFIEDEAFIGTDSQLVAPLRIGRGAYIAAGSCITKDVPEHALAIARGRQIIRTGWAARRKSMLGKS